MSDRERIIRRIENGPTVWDRIGTVLLFGFFWLFFVSAVVFGGLALFHLLPCSWYVDGCTGVR